MKKTKIIALSLLAACASAVLPASADEAIVDTGGWAQMLGDVPAASGTPTDFVDTGGWQQMLTDSGRVER